MKKCCCSRKNGLSEKISEFLRCISLGKYSTKLYFNGKAFKGSVATGILTVFISIFLVIYSGILFNDIINKKNYSLELTSREISCLNATLAKNETSSVLTNETYVDVN
jgi:hypothetical protein